MLPGHNRTFAQPETVSDTQQLPMTPFEPVATSVLFFAETFADVAVGSRTVFASPPVHVGFQGRCGNRLRESGQHALPVRFGLKSGHDRSNERRRGIAKLGHKES
jgi:hypothetical protein